jgi:hypothetical protein
MSTLTIEISDADTIQFVQAEAAQGGFADPSGYIQALLTARKLSKQKAEIEAKVLEALDEYERGECTLWQPGDSVKLAEKLLRERQARHEASH